MTEFGGERSGLRPEHFLGSNKFIEFVCLEIAKRETGLFESRVIMMRLFRYLSRLVVADLRGEGGHQHKRAVGVILKFGGVGFDSVHAELTKAAARIGQELNGVKKVMNDDRLEDVELEVPLGSRKTDG